MPDENDIVVEMVSHLLGCAWGRSISAPGDQERCNEQAKTIVILHDGNKTAEFKLCDKHRDRVFQETDPHIEEEDAR